MRPVLAVFAVPAAVFAAACGGGGPASPSAVRTPVLYATGGQGSVLVAIDPASGAARTVGTLNAGGAFALAARGDGVFFTVTDSGFTPNPDARLATVDPRTGGVTVFGQPFGQYLRMMGLTFTPDGTLYGSSPITNSLYRIDQVTGLPQRVGPFGVNGVMDLAVDPAGSLYANTMTAIYRVDPLTGAATLAARVSGAQALMGIAFAGDGSLYATSFEPDSALYRLDRASGAATLVARTGQGFIHSAEIVSR